MQQNVRKYLALRVVEPAIISSYRSLHNVIGKTLELYSSILHLSQKKAYQNQNVKKYRHKDKSPIIIFPINDDNVPQVIVNKYHDFYQHSELNWVQHIYDFLNTFINVQVTLKALLLHHNSLSSSNKLLYKLFTRSAISS